MSKVIAIFGAGTGLSSSLAYRYGKDDYVVALVGRNETKLATLSAQLRNAGISVETFKADLSVAEQGAQAVKAIEAKLGRIDVLYYAPNGLGAFTAAVDLTLDTAQPRIDIFYYGLVSVVSTALPAMRKRGSGIILGGFGGSARIAFPHFSGVGPAMAAGRNYLHSLQQELVEEGIKVGVVTISAMVLNSDYHKSSLAADAPPPDMPKADPEHLVDILIEVAENPKEFEALFPSNH